MNNQKVVIHSELSTHSTSHDWQTLHNTEKLPRAFHPKVSWKITVGHHNSCPPTLFHNKWLPLNSIENIFISSGFYKMPLFYIVKRENFYRKTKKNHKLIYMLDITYICL